MAVILGNVVSLVASLIMVSIGYIKSREKTVFWQTIQIALNALSCFLLDAYVGCIINVLSIPRNILAYKGKLRWFVKLIIMTATLALSIRFNEKGVIGYLPLISTVSYIWLMDKLDDKYFKMLSIFTLIWWSIHDLYVQSYVGFLFDVGAAVTTAIAIARITRDEKKAKASVDVTETEQPDAQ